MIRFAVALGLSLVVSSPAFGAPSEAAVAAHKEGLRLAKSNLIPEALEALNKAVKADPNYAEAWADLGNTHLAAGALEDAIKAFDRAVKLRPEFQIARYNLAYSLRKTGSYPRAAEQYRLYLQRDPQDADAHYGLAESLKAANDHLAAAEAYEEYAKVERRPGQAKWIQKAEETAKQLRAAAGVAAPAPKKRAPAPAPIEASNEEFPPEQPAPQKKKAAPLPAPEPEEAEDDAHDNVVTSPRPESFSAGVASLKQGDYTAALAKLTSAVKEAPEDALVLAALAGAHLGLQHGPEAEATYRRALATAAPDAIPAIYFGIGESLRFQGETKKALETYQLAMKHEAATANLKKLLTERIDAMK